MQTLVIYSFQSQSRKNVLKKFFKAKELNNNDKKKKETASIFETFQSFFSIERTLQHFLKKKSDLKKEIRDEFELNRGPFPSERTGQLLLCTVTFQGFESRLTKTLVLAFCVSDKLNQRRCLQPIPFFSLSLPSHRLNLVGLSPVQSSS